MNEAMNLDMQYRIKNIESSLVSTSQKNTPQPNV